MDPIWWPEPPEIDSLEIPRDPHNTDMVTGAKLAQLGEFIGRSLQLGPCQAVTGYATDHSITITTQNNESYGVSKQ